jgi:hypothetical protein
MGEYRTNKEHKQGGCLGAAALLLVMQATAGSASAQERVPAISMPCANVAGVVRARGAAVLSTGPYTYERVVRDQGFCELETTTAPAWVPSADNPQCFAGYRCRPIERGESRPD